MKKSTAIGQLSSIVNKGWLKVDSKPVKQALATWVNKWQFRYTSYLQESVESTLTELNGFMVNINEGLSEVEPDDAEALLEGDDVHRDAAADTVNNLFDPLRQGVAAQEVWRHHLRRVPGHVGNAPYDWASTSKSTYSAREQLAPLQALQAEKIKEQAEDFGIKVQDFRAAFSEEAPFTFAVYEEC